MALKIRTSPTDHITFDSAAFIPEESTFVLRSSHAPNISIQIDYTLKVISTYQGADYHIYLFKNSLYAENHIYQVYERLIDDRIGWIFPIQALTSTSHSYVSNEHFLQYAYVAFEKLCMKEDCIRAKVPDLREDRMLDIYDFYDDDDIILILCKDKTGKIDKFNINNYLPSLFKYGYFFIDTEKTGTFRNPSENEHYNNLDVRLNVESISPYLYTENYIYNLFKHYLPYENHHLVHFSLLYQIIEILIEKIFSSELKKYIERLSDLNDSDTVRFFEIKEDLLGLAKEQERIKKIFNDYLRQSINYGDLKISCDSFLEKAGVLPTDSITKSLYNVRNILFHGYRRVNQNMILDIKTINVEFEKIVVDLLNNYDE